MQKHFYRVPYLKEDFIKTIMLSNTIYIYRFARIHRRSTYNRKVAERVITAGYISTFQQQPRAAFFPEAGQCARPILCGTFTNISE